MYLNLYKESLKKKKKLIDTENRLVVTRFGENGVGGKMGEGGQKVQISRYKINKSWGCNIQHGDYS